MGTPVPPDEFELIDGKYYRAQIERYSDIAPDGTCSRGYVGTGWCCVTGKAIKDWMKANNQCSWNPLCSAWPEPTQKLTGVEGEYDTFMLCMIG